MANSDMQNGWAVRLALFLITMYQRTLSPLVGQSCRYQPTCSHYSRDAYRIHGFWRGSWLTLRRIGRGRPLTRLTRLYG